MKNKLTDNLVLKIGSVLFAGVLWLLVTNINDPSTPKRFTNVPVKIINTDLITNQGKVYEVLDDTDVIDSVVISAPNSIIGAISQNNIIAIADMKNLTTLNTIAITISTDQYYEKLDKITQSSDKVELNIENRDQLSFPLKAVTSGELTEGYIIGNVSTDQNLVSISGPESVISQIKKAEVAVDITGFTNDIGTNAEIKLYDADERELSKERLTLNINSVGVKIEILSSKQIPLQFEAMGTPAAGYRANGIIEAAPSSILVAGKSNQLKNLSVLEIPDTALDITGLSQSLAATVNIKDYLPNNLELADSGFDGNIAVVVSIEPEIVRSITMAESDISVVNLPEGYEATVTAYEEQFNVQIKGLAADINVVNTAEIKGSLDVQALMQSGVIGEMGEGYFDVPLSLNLPDNVELKEKVTVRLTIKVKE